VPTALLAAAPITWGVCELPSWGTVAPAGQVLDEIARAGFHGTELGPDGYLAPDARALVNALHSRALQLVGAFFPLPLYDPDGGHSAIAGGEALAKMLAAANCKTLVAADAGDDGRRAIAGRVPAGPTLSKEQWQRAGDTLAELARRTAQYGVEVVFHPHAGTYVETETELDALMRAAPADLVFLCLDTGHIAYGGGDPVAVARRYGTRVRHVHVKDVSGDVLNRVREHALDYSDAVGQGVFTPLGEGMVDFGGLVTELKRQRYAGWWVLEQDVRLGEPWPYQDPLENARRSRQYLAALLG